MRRLLTILALLASPLYAGETCTTDVRTCGGSGGGGTVTGPAVACTDNAIVRWDGATTTAVQCSTPTISDAGAIAGLTGVSTTSVTDSGLTSGRVPIAGTAGLLGDDADLTFATDTLTATKLIGTTSATSAAVVGSTSTCGGGAVDATGSVCLTTNSITGEGTTADASETVIAFGDATADQTITWTGAASSLGAVVASPAVAASSTAGNDLSFSASPAIAGNTNNGAAAGGNLVLNTGVAARLVSGNANGGDIIASFGAGIGTGRKGFFTDAVGNAGCRFGGAGSVIMLSCFNVAGVEVLRATRSSELQLDSASQFSWSNTTSIGSADTGLSRDSAGVVRVTNGSTGGGGVSVYADRLTDATMTAGPKALARTVSTGYSWTNAQVAALAGTAGDITVATLPAKTQVVSVIVIITGAAVGPTTVTISCGDAIGGTPFINYIVPSDAKAAANTVYGDASSGAETGTSLFDATAKWIPAYLPSYTATTLVTCHFISTVANLSTVTGSSGTVVLTTRALP